MMASFRKKKMVIDLDFLEAKGDMTFMNWDDVEPVRDSVLDFFGEYG